MQAPMLAIVGPSGVGKTTFLEGLIPLLQDSGLRIGVIKHHPGDFEFDRPGKDGWRLGQSGAQAMAVLGAQKLALLRRFPATPSLEQVREMLGPVDLILGEGFKTSSLPKVHLFRSGFVEKWWVPPGYLVAVVSDGSFPETGYGPAAKTAAPVFGWDELEALAARLVGWWQGEVSPR